MSAIGSPLSPRSQLRNAIVETTDELDHVLSYSDRTGKTLIQLSQESMNNNEMKDACLKTAGIDREILMAYANVRTGLQTKLGLRTIAYIKAGGSLEKLAEAVRKTPEDRGKFIKDFTPVFQKYGKTDKDS